MSWVDKKVVAAALATRCEVQIAYAIGKAEPVGLFIETFGTETVDAERISDAVLQTFDLRPAAIIPDLALKRPLYAQTPASGPVGRGPENLPGARPGHASTAGNPAPARTGLRPNEAARRRLAQGPGRGIDVGLGRRGVGELQRNTLKRGQLECRRGHDRGTRTSRTSSPKLDIRQVR